MDPYKLEEKGIEYEKRKTAIEKEKFIEKIRGGFGDEIKQNAGVIKVKKVGFFKRVFRRIMETF
mgnify:CR=1 FL=1